MCVCVFLVLGLYLLDAVRSARLSLVNTRSTWGQLHRLIKCRRKSIVLMLHLPVGMDPMRKDVDGRMYLSISRRAMEERWNRREDVRVMDIVIAIAIERWQFCHSGEKTTICPCCVISTKYSNSSVTGLQAACAHSLLNYSERFTLVWFNVRITF